MVSSSEDGTIKVWDVRSPSIPRNFKHEAPVNEVVIHPDQGELLSCDRDGNVRVWDIGEIRCTQQLTPENDVSLQSLSIAGDGSMLVAANKKGNCFVWTMPNHTDASNLKPVTKFKAHSNYITRIMLSFDVKYLGYLLCRTRLREYGL